MKSLYLTLLFATYFITIQSEFTKKGVNHYNANTQPVITKANLLNLMINGTSMALNKTNTTTLHVNELVLHARINNETLETVKSLRDLEEHFENSIERMTCSPNITKHLLQDNLFKAVSTKISNLLFTTAPAFDLSKVIGVSRTCKKHSVFYKKELQKLTMWALRMYDSTAKVPSGLLNGNVNQFGDFDQCLSVSSESGIKGKYCLTYLQIEVPDSPYLAMLHDLAYSHFPFRSRLSDPGHRVPRISTINWGVCVPDSCTPHDVELGVQQLIATPLSELGLHMEVEVKKEMCQSTTNHWFPLSSLLVGLFFVGILALTAAATIYDYRSISHSREYLMAFSLRKNVASLLSLERPEGDIASVHGIRFLNAFMLIAAHKSMALFFNPYINRTEMSEILGRPWSVLGRAASLYTDPFIMFSGLLTTYSFIGKFNRNQEVNILKEYLSRLFRLLPTLSALILFCTFILPWVGSGPQWPLVITHHAEICKVTWWRNLLFIHNYFGFKNMCLTHTHHVGIDTQLFVFSPIMIWLIWKWPRKGMYVLVALATLSTCMRYYVTYTMKLSNYVHFGSSITQLFETADYMYILPAHRLTVYIMGVILGYCLRNTKKIYFEPAYLKAGNALALLLFCIAFFGPSFMGSINYTYNAVHAAWYAAFAPIAWCSSFMWIIYTSHFGYEGFLITTRLSYAIYLTQFPVFFYNVGVTRSSEQYTFVRMQINIPEFLNILLYSVILTLLFDTPFQNIKTLLFKRKAQAGCELKMKGKKAD